MAGKMTPLKQSYGKVAEPHELFSLGPVKAQSKIKGAQAGAAKYRWITVHTRSGKVVHVKVEAAQYGTHEAGKGLFMGSGKPMRREDREALFHVQAEGKGKQAVRITDRPTITEEKGRNRTAFHTAGYTNVATVEKKGKVWHVKDEGTTVSRHSTREGAEAKARKIAEVTQRSETRTKYVKAKPGKLDVETHGKFVKGWETHIYTIEGSKTRQPLSVQAAEHRATKGNRKTRLEDAAIRASDQLSNELYKFEKKSPARVAILSARSKRLSALAGLKW